MIGLIGDVLAYLFIGGLTIWIWTGAYRGHREVITSSWLAIRVPKSVAILFAGNRTDEPILDMAALFVQAGMLSMFVGMILQDLGIVANAGIVLYCVVFFMIILIALVLSVKTWRKWRH